MHKTSSYYQPSHSPVVSVSYSEHFLEASFVLHTYPVIPVVVVKKVRRWELRVHSMPRQQERICVMPEPHDLKDSNLCSHLMCSLLYQKYVKKIMQQVSMNRGLFHLHGLMHYSKEIEEGGKNLYLNPPSTCIPGTVLLLYSITRRNTSVEGQCLICFSNMALTPCHLQTEMSDACLSVLFKKGFSQY